LFAATHPCYFTSELVAIATVRFIINYPRKIRKKMELLKYDELVSYKVQSSELVNHVNNEVQSGRITPLSVIVRLKAMRDSMEKLEEMYLGAAIEQLEATGETSLDINGIKVYKNAGGRYDYSTNSEIKELYARIKSIQDAMKQAYEADKAGANFVTGDGEIVEPAKYIQNKPSITVRF
jgi:hypothetical protein